MKHISTMATVVASLITFTFISTPAHAEGINDAKVEATCDSITITAPAYGRIIWSIDAEPPMEVSDGGTATAAFFKGGVDANLNQYTMDSHHWTAGNVTTGTYQSGDITGCAPDEPQPVLVGYVNPDPVGFAQPVIEYKVPEVKTVVVTTNEVVTMRLHSPW